MLRFLYLDIDGVLSLGSEISPKLTEKWGYVHRFNIKAVNILNEIIDETGAEIIISSDWKNHYDLKTLQEIFVEFAKIKKPPIDITPTYPYQTLQLLEEIRAKEILAHVNKIKPYSWVAIDDLNLKTWIPEKHFVICTRFYEGIKQTGKRDEIIKKLLS